MGRFKDDAWEDGFVNDSPLRPKPPMQVGCPSLLVRLQGELQRWWTTSVSVFTRLIA